MRRASGFYLIILLRSLVHFFGSLDVVFVPLHIESLKVDFHEHVPEWQKPAVKLVLDDPILDAYMGIHAGLSEGMGMKKTVTALRIDLGGHVAMH